MKAVLASLVLVVAALAGCLAPQPTAAVDAASVPGALPAGSARVVVADVDTGINPYHVEFRDDSPEAWMHPSTYLAGFPEDARELRLTLDAADYDAAVAADCAAWKAVEPGVLYWIPGTRIVGAITFEEGKTDCAPKDKKYPARILDPQGHGTMTASRAVGATYSLCPECKLVFVQGFDDASMLWAAEQPYVDLQTNSWGALPTDYGAGGAQDRATVMKAAAMQPVFVAGGNGLLGFFGVTGHPAYLDDVAGPRGIVMVGGHDGGRFTPWTMTMPHVVADANWHPAAESRSLDAGDDRTGGGTSGATPFAASAFARMLLDARKAVGDAGTGVRNGSLVLAPEGAALPPEGPLADGALTVEEAKAAFYRSANPRPVRDGDRDGDTCSPEKSPLGCTLYATTPIEWGMIPDELPAYYFVGYGQVGELTLERTLAVVLGMEPMPERPTEDAFYGFDDEARGRFDG